MKEEMSPLCQNCYREQHINLQKPQNETVFVCQTKSGAVKIQNSMQCGGTDCIYCKCTEPYFSSDILLAL